MRLSSRSAHSCTSIPRSQQHRVIICQLEGENEKLKNLLNENALQQTQVPSPNELEQAKQSLEDKAKEVGDLQVSLNELQRKLQEANDRIHGLEGMFFFLFFVLGFFF